MEELYSQQGANLFSITCGSYTDVRLLRTGPEGQPLQPGPTVDPFQLALSARDRLPVPQGAIEANPTRSLVGLPTFFWYSGYDGRPLTRTTSAFGVTVEVEATPTDYRWTFGDGASLTSEGLGRAYPARSPISPHLPDGPPGGDGALPVRVRGALAHRRWPVGAAAAAGPHRQHHAGGGREPDGDRPMSSPERRRRTAAVGLLASLAGLPALLVAAAGPPALGGLPSWGWVADGLRDQYLPVEPLLAALGLFAWALWGYAVLVTMLRVVAVAAARRGIAGSVGLLSFSNLVTLAPLRSLVDAAVGVSLLASAPHAVAAPVTLAGPPAVVRTIDGSAGWDRAQQLLGAVHPSTAVTQPVRVRRPAAAAASGDLLPGRGSGMPTQRGPGVCGAGGRFAVADRRP